MQALKVLASKIEGDFIDKKIISSIWTICHLGRIWALYPDRMLQNNKLITEEQIIDNWLCDISYAPFWIWTMQVYKKLFGAIMRKNRKLKSLTDKIFQAFL